MSPRPFYEVKPSHYLFNKQEKPEEKVRQWILFELLSTYAVHIESIDVEKPVRVGTRPHYADIVIYQDHIPYIVIECKNQEDKYPDKGLEQAISYASCLGAKFAVYTNGRDWKVRRFLDSSWEVVPDLPIVFKGSATKSLDDLANYYQRLMPILYWMYQPITLEYRNYIYRMLQEFFMDCSWYCNSGKEGQLCESADDLFRVALSASEAEYCREEALLKLKNDSNYIDEKSRYSYREFLEYCKDIDFSHIGGRNPEYMVKPGSASFDTRMIAFSQDLATLAKDCKHLSNLEANVIKLMALVMKHLWSEWMSNKRTVIPEAVMLQFLKIATPLCETYFGVKLPEREESGSWSSFRDACWEFASKLPSSG